MNLVVLVGRLTKDPDIRYTQQGTCVASFTVAVDRRVKAGEQKQADFINCVAWQKTAEAIGNYVSKGRKIGVEGRLQVRSYDDKDGKKRWVTEVICNSVEFLQPKKESSTPDVSDEAIPF